MIHFDDSSFNGKGAAEYFGIGKFVSHGFLTQSQNDTLLSGGWLCFSASQTYRNFVIADTSNRTIWPSGYVFGHCRMMAICPMLLF